MIPNFVDYGDQQARLFPSLFIGLVGWPEGWFHSFEYGSEHLMFNRPAYEAKCALPTPVRVELPERLIVTQHQTAGTACGQIQLFGYFFALPDGDRLITVAQQHGDEAGWIGPSWPELLRWHFTLEHSGLQMAHMGYRHFQEAFVPLDALSAFGYACNHASALICPEGTPLLTWRDDYPNFDSLRRHIGDAWEAACLWRPWEQTEQEKSWAKAMSYMRDGPISAIVAENSD